MRTMLFARVVMRPPIAPRRGVLAEGRAGDGRERGTNQILRRCIQRIVIQKIQQLRNHSEPLLPCEQRSEEHTSELQSRVDLVCRLLLEKKNTIPNKKRQQAHRDTPTP